MNEIAMLIRDFCDTEEGCRYCANYTGAFNIIEPCIALVVNGNSNNIANVSIKLCDFLYESGIKNIKNEVGIVMLNTTGMESTIYFPKIGGGVVSYEID